MMNKTFYQVEKRMKLTLWVKSGSKQDTLTDDAKN